MRRIFKSDFRIVLSAILVALAVRILVISSNPAFILGGDTPGYAAFTHEIIQNGMVIPGLNILHYPGSFWVYPPLLPYFWSLLVKVLGNSTIMPFYVIETSGMVIDSLVIIPLFLTARMVFGRKVATVSAFLYTVYLPDLFALTWGGVPQLFATFLFAFVIYFTVLISREETRYKKNAVLLGIILAVLTFTHDLTIFVMIFSLVLIILASAFFLKVKFKGFSPDRSHLLSIVTKLPISIAIAVPALLIWYIPRYWWVIDAGAPYVNANLPIVFTSSLTFPQLIFQGVEGYFAPLGFAILLIPLMVYSVRYAVKHAFEKSGILLSFMAFPVLLSIIDFHDPTIVSRIGYYSFLPSLVITSRGIMQLYEKYSQSDHTHDIPVTQVRKSRRSILAALIVPLILVSALGVGSNVQSHTFYNTYVNVGSNQVIDYSTLGWIHSNLPQNSTFASFGELGYYIMGYDGNPTLVYQNLKYLTQPVEWNESIAAYNLVYRPDANVTLTHGLISKYNVSYVTSMAGVSVPSFYKEVYSNQNFIIYNVR